jgi:putative ABC transport system permease protein
VRGPGLSRQLWEAAYDGLVRLLPARVGARTRSELRETVHALLGEAASEGWWALQLRGLRECRDIMGLAVRGRWGVARGRPRPPWESGAYLQRKGGTMSGWVGDLGQAARALARRRGFAFAAVATLALGIGTATAMFAVVDTLFLRPLPYPDGHRLVMVWRTVEGMRRAPVSLPDLVDWRAEATQFEDVCAYAYTSVTLLDGGDPLRLEGRRVTGSLFGLLGVPVALGRPILDTDDRPDAEPVVVLSHELWATRFAADPGVVGRMVTLSSGRLRVVGVARAGFSFPSAATRFWTPLRVDPASASRDTNYLVAIGRLRPGVDQVVAQEALRRIVRHVSEAHPGENRTDDVWLESRKAFEVGDSGEVALLLGAAVALLLLLASANLAGLLVVRATGRRRELAVRSALGAGQARLLRALLSEAAILAVGGGLLGESFAAVLLHGLSASGSTALLRRGVPALDATTVAFGLSLAALCALACSWGPARWAARRAPGTGLREQGRSRGGGGRVRDALVVAQVTLATTLLLGGGLLERTVMALTREELGFDPARVLTAQVPLQGARYSDPAAARAFYQELLATLSRNRSVESAAASWAPPFGGAFAGTSFLPDDAPAGAEPRPVSVVPVQGDYFRALRIPVVEGRDFLSSDAADAPAVAIVARGLARRLWPGRSPLGKHLVKEGEADMEVVGVAGDVRDAHLDEAPGDLVYLPQAQSPWARDDFVLLRAPRGVEPIALAPILRDAVSRLDPTLPVWDVALLGDRVSGSVRDPRLRGVLVASFAAAAALLAMIGIYGVLAYRVAERRGEVAVRMALGAGTATVLRSVLLRAAALGAVGLITGLVVFAALAPGMDSFLFHVSPFDPAVYGGVAALVSVSVLAAGWGPARRAARVAPMTTLREE